MNKYHWENYIFYCLFIKISDMTSLLFWIVTWKWVNDERSCKIITIVTVWSLWHSESTNQRSKMNAVSDSYMEFQLQWRCFPQSSWVSSQLDRCCTKAFLDLTGFCRKVKHNVSLITLTIGCLSTLPFWHRTLSRISFLIPVQWTSYSFDHIISDRFLLWQETAVILTPVSKQFKIICLCIRAT